jgi:hypothetical protein
MRVVDIGVNWPHRIFVNQDFKGAWGTPPLVRAHCGWG